MITTDCPLCAGEAITDEALTNLTCDGCGVTVEIAPDTIRPMELAA